jgi:hypothetical protein
MTKKKKLANKARVVENHGLKCEDCGKRSPEVKHTTCPFDEEVRNTITECDLCPDCERERARDI